MFMKDFLMPSLNVIPIFLYIFLLSHVLSATISFHPLARISNAGPTTKLDA